MGCRDARGASGNAFTITVAAAVNVGIAHRIAVAYGISVTYGIAVAGDEAEFLKKPLGANVERKAFLAASAMVAAMATDACAKGSRRLELVESQSEFDYGAFEKLVGRPFDVRQLWDMDGYVPTGLGGIKNAFNGYQFGFGIAPARIGMAACLHGTANAFAYNDAMWTKYRLGEAFGFKDPNGNVVATNIFYHARSQESAAIDPNDPGSAYQDGTIEALQRRGLMVMVCHTAAGEQGRSLVAAGAAPSGMSPGDVQRDLLANLVPEVTVVPSMVSAIGILQNRFRYAYTAVSQAG